MAILAEKSTALFQVACESNCRVILPYPPKKGGVRYPLISEPLNYCGFNLIRLCDFKDCWLPVKQVLYINKNQTILTLISAFSPSQPFLIKQVSLFQPFLRLLVAASLNKTLKSLIPHLRRNPQNPQSPVHPQTLRARRTHKPSESGALTTSNRRRFFSSNPLVGAAL